MNADISNKSHDGIRKNVSIIKRSHDYKINFNTGQRLQECASRMSTQDKDCRSVLVECQHRTKITGVY